LRLPTRRRVFPDASVDGFAQEVGVAGVAAVLLDQVAQQPAQARMLTLGRGHVHDLVEPATR
jgi:hypothetical protein